MTAARVKITSSGGAVSTVRPGRRVHAVVDVLADGTPCYAPIGEVVSDGPHVQCHLCGAWFRSVLRHLRAHGWDQLSYRAAFGLERGQSLEGDDTRRRRAVALAVRRVHDPAIRAGSEVGEGRARSGTLSREAAEAARGRRQSEQRRRKTLQALAAISPQARAAGSRRSADERRRRTAAEAAARLGHPDIGSLVRDRVAAGASLAAISREAGLHKDWLCRHLAKVDPVAAREVAVAVTGPRPIRRDARWIPVVRALGFDDVAGYLADRYLSRRLTVSAIAAEVGMSRPAVDLALRRHGVPRSVRPGGRAPGAGRRGPGTLSGRSASADGAASARRR
ncbi:hypothetical protein [Pseudonocardia acidicola]|uniref:ROS/MUCR transcriptional regulator protein n=1 Tax=Pseudonocardia acidicola TaxID=2724939 RepID=A0ABX1SHC0_9PSEU|nr:hypothetical protein [Pseudonocardia acidicola]NMI00975.1 hypothetical protein [Pseudonocardia acidicola]